MNSTRAKWRVISGSTIALQETFLDTAGERLIWRGNTLRKRRLTPDLLIDFVNLASSEADAILRYARKWGLLNISFSEFRGMSADAATVLIDCHQNGRPRKDERGTWY